RTLAGIIWSCIATLVACTWVSVHPNVPGPGQGTVGLVLHRFKLMLLAIVAPEIIVLWALRQRMVARKLSKEHKMTIVHGFFVSMGGFVRLRGDALTPVASHDIGQTVNAKTILNVKVGEIQDRSKGDELSKGLAFLQTSWFIVQCIARGYQRLPLTELEIVTLAFAALNIVIRLIWWNKPLDVRYPVTITTSGGGTRSNTKMGPDPTVTPAKPHEEKLGPDAIDRFEPVASPKPTPAGDLESRTDITAHHLLMRSHKAFLRACDDCVDIVLMMFEGEEDDVYIRKSATRVPTLWAGRLDGWQRATAATIGITLAMAFGAIHFVAWNSSFPTQPEKILWQVAAVLVVAVPFLFFLGAATVLRKGKINRPYYAIIFNGILPLGVLTYVIARVILMVLPFMSLRSLPTGAFKDIEWVKFIPHVG
ncbi:hypothetical protein BDZ94DRAFT_1174788, partial [Collybia nuda]